MAGESEYYHPIIQAMIESQHIMQNRAQLNENIKRGKEEQKLKEHQQQIAEKQNEQAHDLALQHLELARHQAEVAAESAKFARSSKIAELLSSGAVKAPTKSESIPNVPGIIGGGQSIQVPQPFKFPGTEDIIDPSMYANPQEVGRRKIEEAAGMAGATAGATARAQAPFKQAESDRATTARLKEIAAQGSNQQKIAEMNIAGRQGVAETSAESRALTAQISALARLQAAGQGVQAPDSDTIQSYIDGVFLTGNTKESAIPQKLRPIIRSAAAKGGFTTPLTDKDNEQINGIPIVSNFFAKARELADKGSGLMGKAGAITGMGEAGNVKQEVDGLLGNIARIFGGEKGVLTQRDIERARGDVYSLAQGKAGNLKKIDDLETIFKSKIEPILNKYPEVQRKHILESRGIDYQPSTAAKPNEPAFLKLAPQTNKSGHKLNREKSIELGQPVYN